MSVLDYGDIIYIHASASTLKPLDVIYHSGPLDLSLELPVPLITALCIA